MTACKKWLCIALAALTVFTSTLAFVGCADTSDDPDAPETQGQNTETGDGTTDDRFVDVNYGGDKPFRIYTSTNAASTGMGNSNFLIEGSHEVEGDIVNDAVLERNLRVEKLLGIKLEFTQVDLSYTEVPTDVRKLTESGLDEYDLLINDLFPFAQLTIEGHFCNTLDEDCVFDFDRPYWYGDYMEDLRLMDGYQHLLAGDYFIDIIRSAHLLLLNKQIYENNYRKDPNELYDTVIDMKWTYAAMNDLISDMWADKNSSGEHDKGDQFGFITCEYWGGSIAYTISGNPNFIERDEDGVPNIILGEGDRANQLAAAMSAIFNNESSSVGITPETELLQAFAADECLIIDYQRLGSLENEILQSMEGDACVLPYPMLFESDQKYTTSAHDTTEVGAILTTSIDNLEYISTVVEVLNRETANILMPQYYSEGLQVQYVDDSKASHMIDIIHDNFDNSFALAYNNTLGQKMLEPFCQAMQDKREFSVVYKKNDAVINRTLGQRLKTYQKTLK